MMTIKCLITVKPDGVNFLVDPDYQEGDVIVEEITGYKLSDGRFLTKGTASGMGDDLWVSVDAYAPNGLDELVSIEELGAVELDQETIDNADRP